MDGWNCADFPLLYATITIVLILMAVVIVCLKVTCGQCAKKNINIQDNILDLWPIGLIVPQHLSKFS